MEIYFVRHGETMGNVAMRHQADATPLTDRGLKQAREVAERLKAIAPTHLLSSSMVRTLETARIIGDACDLIPETSPLFVEIGRPIRLRGHFLKSAASLWFYLRWYFGLTNTFNDGGETYKAFRDRIRSATTLLENYPEDARVIVVSHAVFINFFVMHMCDGRRIGLIRALVCFSRILRIKNGSVTKIRLDHKASNGVCKFALETASAHR